MEWNVIAVKPVAPLALEVELADGTVGQVRFEPSHLTGVLAALKAPFVFQQAHIDDGAVTWPGHVDLAPDAIYEAINPHTTHCAASFGCRWVFADAIVPIS